MTTVVEVLNRIARQCSVKAPTSWLNATRDEYLEIRDDFLQETVDDLLERVDWGEPLTVTTTITGPGTSNTDGSSNHTLPTDYTRTNRDKFTFYDNNQDRVGVPVTESGMWEYITDLGTSGVYKYYRVKGYEGNYTIDIYRALDSGDDISFQYMSKNWLRDSTGSTAKSSFTAADDIIVLPRRVIEVGTIARYRRRRGLEYGDMLTEYEELVQRYHADSRNLRTIRFGEPDLTVKWQDLVPDFIPDS